MILRYAVVFVTVLLAGCNPELSRRDARNAIGEYLDDAGLHLGETPWAGIAISIEWILRPTNGLRTVRFQLVTAYQSSDPYDAAFTRSDAGWSLNKFDPDIFDLVADIGLAGRVALLSDLIAYLEHLGDGRDRWTVTATRLANVPSRSELEEHVRGDSLPPDLVTWGVYPADEPLLIWVQDSTDQGRVCVISYDWDRQLAMYDDFGWVKGDSWRRGQRVASCNGDDGVILIPTRHVDSAQLDRLVAGASEWLD